jgi:hypothetical protein
MFYQNGSTAAKDYNRQPNQDIYWSSRVGQNGRYRLWHSFPALAVDNSK